MDGADKVYCAIDTVDIGLAARLIEQEGRVCRIEAADGFSTTGVLVAPDVVLTVASGVVPRLREHGGAVVRFDDFYRLDAPAERGTVHALASRDWLIDARLPEGDALDAAFIRLSFPVGYEPVGSTTRAAPGAPARGFVRLTSGYDAAGPGLLLYYPTDGPLAMLRAPSVQRASASSGELRYRAGTPMGAAGAPILNGRMEPVGLHLGAGSGWRSLGMKRGVTLEVIAEWARGRPALAHVLRDQPM